MHYLINFTCPECGESEEWHEPYGDRAEAIESAEYLRPHGHNGCEDVTLGYAITRMEGN